MFENFVLKRWQVILFVLAGTLVRLCYGLYSKAWLGAPDQLAWGLAIDEMMQNGSLCYRQLVHYPHEGGSALLALIAIAFKPLAGIMPGLSWAALFADTISRFVQVSLGQKLFGTKAALWYSAWLVFSVPLLLSWATVNFGLHYLASFFPFVFAYVVFTFRSKPFYPWLCGSVAGLATCFSFDSFMFIPAFIIFILFEKITGQKKPWLILKFLAAFGIALIPHILFRVFADSGFHLEKLSASGIRGLGVADLDLFHGFKHLLLVWIKPLPASFFLAGPSFWILQHVVVLAFILAGLYFAYAQRKDYPQNNFPVLLILFFFIMYAFSPFYEPSAKEGSYVSYRHIAYILPLFVMLLISVYANAEKKGKYMLAAWFFASLFFTARYWINTEPVNFAELRAEGWVLARKFGDDPGMLVRLKNAAPPEQQRELCIGFGWGLAATLLSDKSLAPETGIEKLHNLVDQLPEPCRKFVIEGVDTAFAPGITPVLDPGLLNRIRQELAAE